MPRQTIYSEEVQEIMGRIPGWVVRWGLIVLFFLFLLIMGITWFVRYPETISAPIVLTTLNPPADLIARSSNKIEYILVKDGASVKKDDVVAVLYNTGDFRSVLELENILLQKGEDWKLYFSKDFLRKDYSLGELQSYYIQFVKQCLLYDHYLQTDFTVQKQKLIEANIVKTQQTIESQNQQMSLLKKDMEFENRNLERDSLLLHSEALTPADYERTRQSVLQKQIALLSQNTVITSTEANLINMEQQLLELQIQRDNETTNYQVQLSEAREQLLMQINLWKEKYILQSPIEGKVTFTKYWSSNQNVISGERLASVVPDDSLQIIGKMYIPSQGFAKVKPGQIVNVKLNGFPYMEYGILKGKIHSLSSIPEVEGYAAEVAFEKGLISSYNTRLKFIQQMDGTGDIITKDQRLLERFLSPLKSAIKNDL